MAILIDIEKMEEDAESILFSYGHAGTRPGQLRFDKKTFDVEQVSPSEKEAGGRTFAAAKYKITKTFSDKKTLPDKLVYAA